MMSTDAELAGFCGAIYQPSAPLAGFDHYDAGMDDGVCWGLKKLIGCDVLIFRGSLTLTDWLDDFRALAVPSRIGHVHRGFYAGMERVAIEAKPMLSQPVIVTGHSLGAARAAIMTAIMVVDGLAPIARVVFGEPKPGLMDLAAIVGKIPARSYRNGDALHHDLVTDVPFSFPPLQYVHPTPIVPVCCRPRGDEFEAMGVFAWHHIELYETALAVLKNPKETAA